MHSYVTAGHHHLDPLHTAQPCYCWISPSPPPVQLCITRELLLHAKWLDFCADPVILASTLIRVVLSVPYSVKTELFHVLNYFLVRFLYLFQIFNHFSP